jgi:hypothetical protein
MGKEKIFGPCKLCLEHKELRDSHYIPKRAYSMSMAKSLPNPNPVVLSQGQVKQVSDQLRGHTFCGDCEQMLSDKGEKWVLANIPDDQGEPFPLQEALIPEEPVFTGDEINLYAGRSLPAFNMEKLIYFGMSIFWRAAARRWTSSLGGTAPPVELGEYYEPIRQYLLGAPFPEDVVIFVLIYNRKPAMNSATTVLAAKDGMGSLYWFYLHGLGFKLYLGKDVPNDIRRLCAYRSAEGFVMVDSEFGKMVRGFSKDFLTKNELSPKMQEFLKGPDPRKKPPEK